LAFDKRLAHQDEDKDMCESCETGGENKTVAPVCIGKIAANDGADAIARAEVSNDLDS
jgi:hypothetical protein